MAWIYLLIAGAFEVAWAVGMMYTDSFRRPKATAATIVAMIASVVFLEMATRRLPLGTAYAVWTGIGAIGTATYGILYLHEPVSAGRIVAILLIISGVSLLKVLSPH
jgi:quaternary ammonium compound-resistance protein SugE